MQQDAPYQRHFYQLLAVISLLQNSSTTSFARHRAGTIGSVSTWHRFLDDLCHICQRGRAGEDVVAIGVQHTLEDETVLWIAVNNHQADDVVQLLERILRLLYNSGIAEMSFTRDAFFTLIIERCKKRIQNYRKRLSSCVGSMRSQLAKHSRIDEALRALLTIHDHKEFASQAYRFRKMAACKDLDDLADQQAVYSSWSDLRHLIGRCGSWYRAADFLVRHSPDFRDILQRCSIHGLSNISDYPAFNIEQNIRVLLEQVCSLPRPETDNAVRVLSTASGTREALAKVQKPFVHAEAAVAKHFSTQDFAFVGSDRYIGCSKPPCYCCQLYMKQSHINMGHKETSGRAWLKWALPNDDREGNEATGTYKLDDSKILSDMIDTMKSDVTRSLTHGQYGRKRKHDTTTGITPMIWEDSAQPESVRPSPAPALLQGKSA